MLGMIEWAKQSYQQGERTSRDYLRKHLSKKGADKVDDAMTKVIGPGRAMESNLSFALGAEVLGTAYGMSHRLREGEDFLPALAKEGVENLKYGMFPELIPIQMGKMLAENYPVMEEMAERKRENILNYRTLGGNYQDTQSNYAARSRALEMIKRNKMPAPGGEARRYHRT